MDVTDEDDLTQTIREAMICPVCKKTLTPPIVQCKNGHLICKDHKKPKCPTCGSKISTLSPIFFNQIFEKRQHHLLGRSLSLNETSQIRKCNHPGCSQSVTIGDDHELWCGYRPTVCMFDDSFYNCKWTGIALKLPKHVESKHAGINICREKSYSTFDNVSFVNIDINKHTGWGYFHQSFFWVEAENNAFKHSFTIKLTAVPIMKMEGAHNIWVELRGKVTKLWMVTKLDLDPHSDYPDKNCIKVHTDFLKDIVGADGKLSYKLNIIKDMEKPFENSTL